MDSTRIYIDIHVICMIYCFWRTIKRDKKEMNTGATNVNPALMSLGILFIAPFLAIADIGYTWYQFLKEYYKSEK